MLPAMLRPCVVVFVSLLIVALFGGACGPTPRGAVTPPCPQVAGPFVLADGALLHVSLYAPAPAKAVVVFVHGWAHDGGVFYAQAAALAERYTVVTYDLRGHGDSKDAAHRGGDLATHASDLRAVLAGIGRPVHLVGHDLGALVALRVAIDAPAAITSLTLLSPPLVGDERIRRGYEQLVADYRVDPESYHAWSGLAAGWIGGPYLEAHPELVAWFDAMMARHDHASVIGTLTSTLDAATAPGARGAVSDADLARLGVPTLVLFGTGEGWPGAIASEAKLAALPGVTSLRVSGAVHEAYLEAADIVNAALMKHLATAATTGE